jgi:hypothetical protein
MLLVTEAGSTRRLGVSGLGSKRMLAPGVGRCLRQPWATDDSPASRPQLCRNGGRSSFASTEEAAVDDDTDTDASGLRTSFDTERCWKPSRSGRSAL